MTSYTVNDMKDKTLSAGMNGFIAKPVDITRLNKTLEKIMEENAGHIHR